MPALDEVKLPQICKEITVCLVLSDTNPLLSGHVTYMPGELGKPSGIRIAMHTR
jgi:hypothetical protein